MDEFKNRLKLLRKENKLIQKELADKLNIPRNTLSSWEAGYRIPELSTVQKIADFFNVSIDYLLGRSELKNNLPTGAWKAENFIKIPVLGVIRAGEPLFAVQNIIGYDYLTADQIPSGEIFFLKVIGDSMNLSNIVDGCLVLVNVQEDVENGEIAVVLVNGEDATVKRFYKTDTTVTLMPHSSNPAHQPRVIDIKSVSVKVIGKVVKVVINF